MLSLSLLLEFVLITLSRWPFITGVVFSFIQTRWITHRFNLYWPNRITTDDSGTCVKQKINRLSASYKHCFILVWGMVQRNVEMEHFRWHKPVEILIFKVLEMSVLQIELHYKTTMLSLLLCSCIVATKCYIHNACSKWNINFVFLAFVSKLEIDFLIIACMPLFRLG